MHYLSTEKSLEPTGYLPSQETICSIREMGIARTVGVGGENEEAARSQKSWSWLGNCCKEGR